MPYVYEYFNKFLPSNRKITCINTLECHTMSCLSSFFVRVLLFVFDFFFQSKHPSEYLGGWRNQACARVGAMIGMYSPIKALPKVRLYWHRAVGLVGSAAVCGWFGWLIAWSIGACVCLLFVWLVCWLVWVLTDWWLTDSLIHKWVYMFFVLVVGGLSCLIDRLIGCLIYRLTCWWVCPLMVKRVVDWLVFLLIDLLIYWLIDRLNYQWMVRWLYWWQWEPQNDWVVKNPKVKLLDTLTFNRW